MLTRKANLKIHQEAAIKLREKGNFDEAIKEYLLALQINPDCVSVLLQLAETYESSNKYEKALKIYKKVVKIKPEHNKAHAKLGRVQMLLGNKQKAIAAYEKAIVLNAKQPQWLYNELGKALEQNNQKNKAIAVYEKATELHPKNHEFYLMLSSLYFKKNEVDKAILKASLALELNPKFIPALKHVATIYESIIEFEKARDCYQRLLKLQPNNAIIYTRLANTMRWLEDLKGAMAAYKKAFELKPELPPEWSWVYDEAIVAYKKAVKLQPDNPDIFLGLAQLYLKKGQMNGVRENAEKAIALNPDLSLTVDQNIKEALKQDSNIQPSKPKKHKLVVVATLKNEAPYILEWIAYHRVLKVDYFLIYNNDSTDATPEILQRLDRAGIITYIDWPSKPKTDNQTSAYWDAFSRLIDKSHWISIIDGDEFIVPKKHDDLQSFLSDYQDVAGIAINWKMFGSSGHTSKDKGLVMERFKKCAKADDRSHGAVKSMGKTDLIKNIGIHLFKFSPSSLYVYPDRTSVPLSLKNNKHINHDLIQINHYFTKSKAEWDLKRTRGKADKKLDDPNRIRPEFFFEKGDKNDTEDLSILRFLEKTKQEMKFLIEVAGLKNIQSQLE